MNCFNKSRIAITSMKNSDTGGYNGQSKVSMSV